MNEFPPPFFNEIIHFLIGFHLDPSPHFQCISFDDLDVYAS
jgi:hypothetical protein